MSDDDGIEIRVRSWATRVEAPKVRVFIEGVLGERYARDERLYRAWRAGRLRRDQSVPNF